jgi:ribosome maturation factor RimP
MPSVIDRLKETINRVLRDKPFWLVDLELKGGESYSIIRVFIDKVGGVTISDCVNVSRELSDLLDIEDLIDHRYSLEVSSPGGRHPIKDI